MPDVRALEEADAPAFQALRRLVAEASSIGLGLTLEEELSRPLSEFATQLAAPLPNLVLGAFEDNVLVATAGLARPTTRPSGAHKAVLWGVLTAPTHRRRSLARQLSSQAIAHAFATGARAIYLYVYLPNNAAVSLYESMGFVKTGNEPEVVNLAGVFHDIQSMYLRRTEA
jgi:ribosomal protein S18 acetylase RimI-like enzyme